jgi:hypothetical protein
MKGFSLFAVIAASVATNAIAQGPIGVMERGTFTCELPGDAASMAGIVQPDAGFTILSASRYSSRQGGGTYLRRGDIVTLTSGPRSGESYLVISPGFLRKIQDGQPGKLRCVLQRR